MLLRTADHLQKRFVFELESVADEADAVAGHDLGVGNNPAADTYRQQRDQRDPAPITPAAVGTFFHEQLRRCQFS